MKWLQDAQFIIQTTFKCKVSFQYYKKKLELFGITLFDMALSVALPLVGLETENFNSYSSFGHIIDIAGLSQSQTSPSPSVSSESSGIGSLGSLKSESVNSDSLPSSPQTTEKKIFEPVVQPQPRPKEKKADDVKIAYGGRDVLNLMGNLTDPRWSYRPTVLPPNNPALFFANRSQYHRLGPYGTRTHFCCSGFLRELPVQAVLLK
ncbi:unnamed protein product [Arctia plantaginis]|uniref:Uncharacterized protein n=1 Tax=Arctia plantaginis TaxID=874455 RepID=A0A8S1ANK2_ARCPL|nr:unnamed protein product [Arctia plantaginis]